MCHHYYRDRLQSYQVQNFNCLPNHTEHACKNLENLDMFLWLLIFIEKIRNWIHIVANANNIPKAKEEKTFQFIENIAASSSIFFPVTYLKS